MAASTASTPVDGGLTIDRDATTPGIDVRARVKSVLTRVDATVTRVAERLSRGTIAGSGVDASLATCGAALARWWSRFQATPNAAGGSLVESRTVFPDVLPPRQFVC